MPETVIRLADRLSASKAAVHFHDVAIDFPIRGGDRYEAVAATLLTVQDGEFVCIVGPTGCGKSTLLNVAAGLRPPSSGRVDVFGEPLRGLNRDAGYLFQADALMPWKTAIDNVAVGLEVGGAPREIALGQASAMLGRVGLAVFADRYPHQLSGGQKKRVALAQALVREPRILLMDEPFGPLDAQTRIIMGDLLLGLWQGASKAVLFVTHDIDEAIALGDRVVVMSAGPSARIIGDVRIDLPRPRDVAEIRSQRRFHDLHAQIWARLRDEVKRAYALQDTAGRT